jgi:hypothetical protein
MHQFLGMKTGLLNFGDAGNGNIFQI